jgi:hypothetical protein
MVQKMWYAAAALPQQHLDETPASVASRTRVNKGTNMYLGQNNSIEKWQGHTGMRVQHDESQQQARV